MNRCMARGYATIFLLSRDLVLVPYVGGRNTTSLSFKCGYEKG